MKYTINRKNILTKIVAILRSAGAVHHHPLGRHTLRNDLGLDSLDEVEVVIMIEKFYGIELPETVIENITIVDDLVDVVFFELSRVTAK